MGRHRWGGSQVLAGGAHRFEEPRINDVFFLVCDGLKGLPDVVANVWPLTTVQTCIIHLIRNTFRLASRRDWDRLKRDVKLIYTAPNERRPARSTMWPTPGVPGIRRLSGCGATPGTSSSRSWTTTSRSDVICSTTPSSLECPLSAGGEGPRSLPHRTGRDEVPVSGHPILDPTGKGQTRWTMRWKPALNAFATTSPTAGRQQKPTDEERRKHRSLLQTPTGRASFRCAARLGWHVGRVPSTGIVSGGHSQRALGASISRMTRPIKCPEKGGGF